MAGKQAVSEAETMAEGEWFIELEHGWCLWNVGEMISDVPYRYTYGRTEFEAEFPSATEGIQRNLSTGKVRRLRLKQIDQPLSFLDLEGSEWEKAQNGRKLLGLGRLRIGEVLDFEGSECSAPNGEADGSKAKLPAKPAAQVKANIAGPPSATKADLPTCYFLAASGAQSYEGEFEWVIELEKHWSPWMPGNEPFTGCTDQPLRYTLGRYDFEVNFKSEKEGTQTNLSTGKVRRILRKLKSEPMPTWEGTGIRRRPVAGSAVDLPAAPADSAAHAAQSRRAERRSAGGYAGAATAQLQKTPVSVRKLPTESPLESRPRVSESAHSASQTCRGQPAKDSAIPHYMRGLKSKSKPQA